MHQAILVDRTMVVKIGTETSEPCKITGGAVQGSVLGILNHNVVLESLDDDLLGIYIAKYEDDITIVEDILKEYPYQLTEEEAIMKQVMQRQHTQRALDTITKRAEEKHLKINGLKPQILTTYLSYIRLQVILLTKEGHKVHSDWELKMLGLYFQERPTVGAQIDNLARKTNERFQLLTKLKLNGLSKDKLRIIHMPSLLRFRVFKQHVSLPT